MSIKIENNNYKITLVNWLKKKELSQEEYGNWLRAIEALDEEAVQHIYNYISNHPEELSLLTSDLKI